MHVFMLSCRFICMFSCKVVSFICVFLGSYLKSVDQSECRICDSYALKCNIIDKNRYVHVQKMQIQHIRMKCCQICSECVIAVPTALQRSLGGGDP